MKFFPTRARSHAHPLRVVRRLAGVALVGCFVLLAVHAYAARPVQDPEHGGTLHPMPRPGYLGVSLRDLDAAEATRLGFRGNVMGAMIVTVDRDAPAWAAGLRSGDVLVELNGQPVEGVDALRRRLRECYAGTQVTLRVRRRGDEMSFAVALGDQKEIAQHALDLHLRPAGNGFPLAAPTPGLATGLGFALPAPPPPAPTKGRGVASTLFDALMPNSGYTGLEVDPLTSQLAAFFGVHVNGGLLVTAVSGGSPAAVAGIAAGDVILRAGDKPLITRSDLARALHKGKGNAVTLALLRNHQEMVLSLQPGKRK